MKGGRSQRGWGTRNEPREFGRVLGPLLTVQFEEDYNNGVTIMSEGKGLIVQVLSSPLRDGLGCRARKREKSSE